MLDPVYESQCDAAVLACLPASGEALLRPAIARLTKLPHRALMRAIIRLKKSGAIKSELKAADQIRRLRPYYSLPVTTPPIEAPAIVPVAAPTVEPKTPGGVIVASYLPTAAPVA